MVPVLVAVLISATYATLRYNVIKGVPWSWWPVYTVNKALGLGALAAIVWMLLCKCRGRSVNPGIPSWTVACMGMHVMVSLAIMTPRYYPKYYAAGGSPPDFTALAAVSWLVGAVAAGWMFLLLRRCEQHDGHPDDPLGVIALMVGVHAAVLGVKGWFEPWTWPGYMVPITLISFILGIVGIASTFVRSSR